MTLLVRSGPLRSWSFKDIALNFAVQSKTTLVFPGLNNNSNNNNDNDYDNDNDNDNDSDSDSDSDNDNDNKIRNL